MGSEKNGAISKILQELKHMRESNTRAIAELNSRITNIAFEVTNNGPKPKTVRQPDLRRNTLGIASGGACRIN